MPITRTAMVDDDGSGTTGTILNNAWKQEFYNQIDALAGASVLPWTPIDASGAALVFPASSGAYLAVGKLVTVTLNFNFPVTAQSSVAIIGGLPFVAASSSGLFPAYGISRVWHIASGTSNIYVFNATSGAQITNAGLSGQVVNIAGFYYAV